MQTSTIHKLLSQLSLLVLRSTRTRLDIQNTVSQCQRVVSNGHTLLQVPRRQMSSNERNKGKEIGESTVLVQHGLDFQEVPMAILRSDGTDNSSNKKVEAKSYIDLEPAEEEALVEGFSNYHTPQQLLKILSIVPNREITPVVAVSILKKLFELENNFGYRNEGRSWIVSADNSTIETFARTAIVNRLIDIIVTSKKSQVLVNALDALKCERVSPTQVYNEPDYGDAILNSKDDDELTSYQSKLYNEILVRVSEGRFSLVQVCQAVVSLGKIRDENKVKIPPDLIDKLWVGVAERGTDINTENLFQVFQTLQYFNKSRRLVMNLLEKKTLALWWRMNTKLVAEICSLYNTDKNKGSSMWKIGIENWLISNRLLMVLSKCTSLNIHQVTESELLQIIKTFHALDFCDQSMDKAVCKYMKAKCLKIIDPQLVATIMDYAKKFRLRSPFIFNAAAQYIEQGHTQNLSAPQFCAIFTGFGHLNYQPQISSIKFWEIVERHIDEKYIQFTPNDLVEVLLSCVYLQKYPLNFVDRVFSSYFLLDRLHSSERDYVTLQKTRSNLKLLDTALTIECALKYRGPLLPKDFTAKSLYRDGRVLRMLTIMEELLHEMVRESGYKIETNVILPQLPLNELYLLDMLITPKDQESSQLLKHRINLRSGEPLSITNDLLNTEEPNLIAVNIHIAEHFSSDGNHLIGSQVMKSRHLTALGFSVVDLKYDSLLEFKMHPSVFRSYFRDNVNRVVEKNILNSSS